MVGTIQPRKNHRTALEAIKQVRARFPEARLTLVGRSGWMSDEIQRDIRRAEARGEAIWLAEADDDEMERAYAGATLAISPSHYEGFGLPVLEAMARGIPVVASDIRAHREVAGEAALYAASTDPEELAARMLALIDDPSLADRLAECGRARASAFSWEETARRTLRVYEAVGPGNQP